MGGNPKHPASDNPFLEVRVRDLSTDPTLRGLCVGYEQGRWRATELARHAMEWLPDFALDYSEREALGAHDAVRQIAKAALSVYTSAKYKKRGEFGEILLHAILRQDCGTSPAISKIYFKTSANDTVKGFDAVHVVGEPGSLELWLGEVKFYSDVKSAIRDVAKELIAHSKEQYLREEFLWVGNKLDPNDPHAVEIRRLLDRNIALDKIFTRICFPILLTYESPAVRANASVDAKYCAALEAEVRSHYKDLVAVGLPATLRVHVIFLPLHTKKVLLDELDERLKAWQKL